MQQQDFTEFVLLKAMYNGDLSQAIFNKDIQAIIDEIAKTYNYEIFKGMVKFNKFNVDDLYERHIKEIEKLNNDPSLVQSYL